MSGLLDGVDPVAFGVALSQLPPTHELVAAARAAVDLADGRAAAAADHRDAQAAVHEGLAGGTSEVLSGQQVWENRAVWYQAGADAAATAVADTVDFDQRRYLTKAADRAETEAQRCRDLASPLPPAPRDPAGAELIPTTAAAVEQARQWVADDVAAREAAEHARWDAAHGYDQPADTEPGRAR